MRKSFLLIVGLFAATIVLAGRREQPLVRPLSRPYSVEQGLDGRAIALWGSHGMYYNRDQQRWTWQRARVWTTVEDLFTSSFTAPYLVPMLENAGAVVMQPRAYVRPGYRSVYVRWLKKCHPKLQTIAVNHTLYEVNTSIGEGVWHYLCAVDKDSCLVESVKGVEYMLLDEHTLGPSGYPRYMEAARYWLPSIGVPDEVWVKDTTYNDYLNDIVCRGGWVNYLSGKSSVNPKMPGLGIPLDMSLAFHTDAGATMNDSLIGTLLIYTNHDRSGSRRLPTGEPRTVSAMLADSIMTQVVNDIRRSYCSIWPRRDLRNANYGETRDPEVPAVLLELLSHQNYADMRYALNPAFRQFVARAVYKGIGRFLARRYDTHFVPQPLTPTALHTVIDGDSLRLLWQPVKDSLEQEAVPSYYIVYVRENDGLWNEGIRVDSSAFAMPMAHGIRYDMCVAAGNEGGISLRSAVVSAFRASNNNRPMLVVDAFDEVRGPRMMAFDSLTGGIVPGARPVPDGYELAYIGEQINYNRRDPWRSDDDCGFGMCNMNRQGQLLVGNTHDYAVRHGKVLQTLHRSFVSCTADGLLPMDTAYTMVDIILGKSGAEHVRHINAVIQDNHWTEGDKRLIMSGAYVGTLSHACASGIVKMDNQSLLFSQELNTERLSAEDVSAVSPLAVSDTVIARYSDTMLPAGIRGENYTIFGFPLECLIEFEDIYSYWLQR